MTKILNLSFWYLYVIIGCILMIIASPILVFWYLFCFVAVIFYQRSDKDPSEEYSKNVKLLGENIGVFFGSICGFIFYTYLLLVSFMVLVLYGIFYPFNHIRKYILNFVDNISFTFRDKEDEI